MSPATPSRHEGSLHATSCTKENTADVLNVKNKRAPDEEWLGGAITSVACIIRRKSFMYLL